MRFKKLTPILFLFLLLFPIQSFGETSILWGNLTPGIYDVGFRSIERYDSTRMFRPKIDYFGDQVQGERSRMIQIDIWYPAVYDETSNKMTYAEYEYSYPENLDFINILSRIQVRYNGILIGLLNGNNGRAMDFMNNKVNAVRDARQAEGTYPLVIYVPNIQTGIFENVTLCEYLASQGYIVATCHPMGTHTINAEPNKADMETSVRDAEFVLAEAKKLEGVDPGHIAAMGFGSGKFGALLLQMRNGDIDAVVAIGGSSADTSFINLIKNNPSYNVMSANRPVMNIYPSSDSSLIFSETGDLRYADIYYYPMNESNAYNYNVMSMISQYDGESEISDPVYISVVNQTTQFLNSIFNFPVDSTSLSKTSPPLVSKGAELPPNGDEFLQIIQRQGALKAVEIYNKFEAEAPGTIPIDEAQINMIGYGLLNQGNPEGAMAIFQLNAARFGAIHANCWDSYADGCVAAGDMTQAEKCYRKVLEVLPNDNSLSDDLRNVLKTNAENFLSNLKESN